MPREVEEELMHLDIARLGPCRARSTALVLSSARDDDAVERWRNYVTAGPDRDECLRLPGMESPWSKAEDAHRSLQPRETMQGIVSIMAAS
jgi:hypothetical protein